MLSLWAVTQSHEQYHAKYLIICFYKVSHCFCKCDSKLGLEDITGYLQNLIQCQCELSHAIKSHPSPDQACILNGLEPKNQALN